MADGVIPFLISVDQVANNVINYTRLKCYIGNPWTPSP